MSDYRPCPHCDKQVHVRATRCPHCREDIPRGVRSKQTHPVVIFAVLLSLGMLACFVIYSIGSISPDTGSARSTSPSALSTSPPRVACCDIEYRVTVPGSGRADITMTNAGGNTEQHSKFLPYSAQFHVPPGTFLYLSAQSTDDVGQRITCEIVSNGKVIETATSTGRYVIATCSGSAR